MLPEKLRETLLLLSRIIDGSVSWAVDGSCSLALQGIDIIPHDVDLLTDREGAFALENLLKEHVLKRVHYGETERYRSFFGIFRIGEVKVEVMGDLQAFREGKWSEIQNPMNVKPATVDLDGNLIPVVPLYYLEKTGYLRERLKRE